MRQGQQNNRRGRGRNTNTNRKSQNPLTRSFESTGPDVKLRGTPSHIAEKYMSLARDAHSSGDPVLAENYMQHAEHYNRIIMSFREQQISQGGSDPFPGGVARRQMPGQDSFDAGEDDEDDGGDDFGPDLQPGMQQAEGAMQPQPQQPPRSFDQPPQRYDNRDNRQHNHNNNRNDHRNNNQNRPDRGENRFNRNDRFDRQDNRQDNRQDRPDFNRNDRGDRQDNRPDHNRPDHNRQDQNRQDQNRQDHNRQDNRPERNDFNSDRNASSNGEPRGFREDRAPQPALPPLPPLMPVQPAADVAPEGNGTGAQAPGPRRRERYQADRAAQSPAAPVAAAAPAEAAHQPEFLRRPVRRPRRDDTDAPAPKAPEADSED